MKCAIEGIGRLTDERPDSPDGRPVLVLQSSPKRAYGPDEVISVRGGRELAWVCVDRWMRGTRPTGRAAEMAGVFVGLVSEAEARAARNQSKPRAQT